MTLVWQSYGEAIKLTVATRAPELGWSPEVQQIIAASVQQIGWTKAAELGNGAPPTAAAETAQQAPVAQAAADPAASKPSADLSPASPSPTSEQVQQMASDLAALKHAVELLASNQDRMAQDIAKLQATDQEVLNKVSANKAAANSKPAANKVAAPSQIAAMPTHRHPPAPPIQSAPPMPSAQPMPSTQPAPTGPTPPQPIPSR